MEDLEETSTSVVSAAFGSDDVEEDAALRGLLVDDLAVPATSGAAAAFGSDDAEEEADTSRVILADFFRLGASISISAFGASGAVHSRASMPAGAFWAFNPALLTI